MKVGPLPVWVDYEFSDTHSHLQLFNSEGHFIDLDTEETAIAFAETVAACRPNKHGDGDGDARGANHTAEEIQAAFKSAMEQLMTRNYASEWTEQKYLQARHRVWNGPNGHKPVPEAVLLPLEGGRDWELMVTGLDGLPKVHKVRESIVNELNEIIGPAESHNSRPSSSGVGFEAKISAEEADRRRQDRAINRARNKDA